MMPWELQWEWVEREIALFELRLTVPEDFLTLNRKNAALVFWDLPDSYPVWLLGSFMRPEKAAHSTYWEAELLSDGLGVVEGQKGCFTLKGTLLKK